MSECILAEQTHAFISSHKWQVAVLPFGATEPHNLHMPYGTDNFQLEHIGRRACEAAFARGAKVLLLPTIPFGVNTNHLKVPGGMAISLTPTTLLKIIQDVVDALERQGVPKLLLLNGHGGNELKPLMRELHHRTKLFICACDWFRMVADVYPLIFSDLGDHAGEIETSLGLELFPQLLGEPRAGSGQVKPSRLESIRRGWLTITRPWHLACPDTGVGDPAAATAEKGRRLMEVIVKRLADCLCELAAAEIDDTFPY
jgi:creatinine amidohydrolase